MKTLFVITLGILSQSTAFAADYKIISTEPVVEQVIEVQLSPSNCEPSVNQPSERNFPNKYICDFQNDSIGIFRTSAGIIGSTKNTENPFKILVNNNTHRGVTVLEINADMKQSDIRAALFNGEIKALLIYTGTALK